MIATDLASFCREAGLTPVLSGGSRQISRQSVASRELVLDKDGIAPEATANQKFNALKNDHRRPT